MARRKPRILVVSPALAEANNGNWHTASRWRRFLAPLAEVAIARGWHGEPVDALIALHARRSAEAIAAFAAAHPARPLALVLTGTDLYRDLDIDPAAQHACQCASHLVLLQEEALRRVPPSARARARVILQSAPRLLRRDGARGRFDFVAVGHLREEKDPRTLMRAACRLPAVLACGLPPRLLHVGAALDPALEDEARRCTAECAAYRWLGELAHPAARRWIARSRALVHASRMEGGANVVIEALRSGVPVLASRIDGNVGLLGGDYEGYFEVGDDAGLAAMMRRFAEDRAYADRLAAQCARREPLFAPEHEAAAVRALLGDLMRHADVAMQGQ